MPLLSSPLEAYVASRSKDEPRRQGRGLVFGAPRAVNRSTELRQFGTQPVLSSTEHLQSLGLNVPLAPYRHVQLIPNDGIFDDRSEQPAFQGMNPDVLVRDLTRIDETANHDAGAADQVVRFAILSNQLRDRFPSEALH